MKSKKHLLVSVAVERNGAMLRVDGVKANRASTVLADMLQVFRSLQSKYPELIAELTPLHGSSVDYVDDDWADESKVIGFKHGK